jgi:hypothetical protein
MTIILYSLTIVWFTTQGHTDIPFAKRPCYTWKSEPNFVDMINPQMNDC